MSSLCNKIQGEKKKKTEQVTTTEATLSLQIIKLHFPYRSIDCTSKLNKIISSDSETATVNNVLAPHSADMAI